MTEMEQNRSRIAELAAIADNLSREHEKLSGNVDKVIAESQDLRKQLVFYTGELRYFSRRLAEESERLRDVEQQQRRTRSK